MLMSRPLSAGDRAAIAALITVRPDLSYTAIARKVGLSFGTIATVAKEMGVARGRRGSILEAYQVTITKKKIARLEAKLTELKAELALMETSDVEESV